MFKKKPRRCFSRFNFLYLMFSFSKAWMYVELYHFEHPSCKQFMMGNFHLLTLPISWSTFHSYMIDYTEANTVGSTKYFKIDFISGTIFQYLRQNGISKGTKNDYMSKLKFNFRFEFVLIVQLNTFLCNYLTFHTLLHSWGCTIYHYKWLIMLLTLDTLLNDDRVIILQ